MLLMLVIDKKITEIKIVTNQEHNVSRVNSIKKKYPKLRQDSKTPTFALTYQGTYITLVQKMGLSKEKAKAIEESYHNLYAESDKWVADKIEQASKLGYIELAFGLRLRTPLLKQVILGNSKTPYEAASESRTAGNALGQSWGMLNNRASSEFLEGARASKHRLDIKPCAHIHDAQYLMIGDDIDTLIYTNTNLTKAVRWQDDLLIYHEDVKLSGQLEIYHPTWATGFPIPNEATKEEIKLLIGEHLKALKDMNKDD